LAVLNKNEDIAQKLMRASKKSLSRSQEVFGNSSLVPTATSSSVEVSAGGKRKRSESSPDSASPSSKRRKTDLGLFGSSSLVSAAALSGKEVSTEDKRNRSEGDLTENRNPKRSKPNVGS